MGRPAVKKETIISPAIPPKGGMRGSFLIPCTFFTVHRQELLQHQSVLPRVGSAKKLYIPIREEVGARSDFPALDQLPERARYAAKRAVALLFHTRSRRYFPDLGRGFAAPCISRPRSAHHHQRWMTFRLHPC